MAITTVGRSYKRKPKEKGPCNPTDNRLHGPFFFLSTPSPAWSTRPPACAYRPPSVRHGEQAFEPAPTVRPQSDMGSRPPSLRPTTVHVRRRAVLCAARIAAFVRAHSQSPLIPHPYHFAQSPKSMPVSLRM